MYAHARAPTRIGIAGGGTDLPVWTQSRVGRCLSLAIDLHAHAFAIARRDGQVVASYRQRDEARAATEIANGLIRESALLHGREDGFEVHTASEVSSRGSGLGVSSAFAVALAAVFTRISWLSRKEADDPRWRDGGDVAYRRTIARDAWTVEIDRLRRPIGRQDHMAATWGGLRLYRFEGEEADVERSFTEDDARWVASQIALVPLSEGHDARAILAQAKSLKSLEVAHEAVDVAVRAVEHRDAGLLAEAISMGQRSKLAIPGAVPDWLKRTIEKVLSVARGCKVAGAGGGGHLVVVCERGTYADIFAAIGHAPQEVRPDHAGVLGDGCA